MPRVVPVTDNPFYPDKVLLRSQSTMLMAANEKSWVDRVYKSAPLISDSLRPGLAVLWRAYICAQYTGTNVRDFALRVSRLYEQGTTTADLRWLVAKGYAEHGQETSDRRDSNHSFRRSRGSFFDDQTCLVLTPGGAALAEDVFRGTERSRQVPALASETATLGNAQPAISEIKIPAAFILKPRWDVIRRELSFAGRIVKRFRVPARNQETILNVFEEDGWAEHIHDPLPVTQDIDAPTRLHDAINRLNRCQINPLLRFHGDGKGTGVFWELSRAGMLD